MNRPLIFALLLILLRAPADAAPMVRLVISEGEFGRYLSRQGEIASLPNGSVMSVSFQYTEYDFRHPYLIADRFCGNGQFIRWGAAAHPSLGAIDLICVKDIESDRPQIGGVGN